MNRIKALVNNPSDPSQLNYIDKYQGSDSATFGQAVLDTANSLAIDANALMGTMYFESRLNPAIQNQTTMATGLIQFMPNTAQSLGTSVDELKAMSGTNQMQYVKKYLKQFALKILTPIDVYLTVFYPEAVGKGADYVIGSQENRVGIIAQQNPIFDPNKTGQITVQQVQDALASYIPNNVA